MAPASSTDVPPNFGTIMALLPSSQLRFRLPTEFAPRVLMNHRQPPRVKTPVHHRRNSVHLSEESIVPVRRLELRVVALHAGGPQSIRESAYVFRRKQPVR